MAEVSYSQRGLRYPDSPFLGGCGAWKLNFAPHFLRMTTVYVLRGSDGRHYIGMTDNLTRRLEEHRRGHTYTTARLGDGLELVVAREFPDRQTAAAVERQLKRWKSPLKAIDHLRHPDR